MLSSESLAQEERSGWQISAHRGLALTSEDHSYALYQLSGGYRFGQSNWSAILRYTDFQQLNPGVVVLGVPVGASAFIMHLMLRRDWTTETLFGYVSGGGGLTAGVWNEGFAGGLQAGLGYRLGAGWSLRAEAIGHYASPALIGGGALGIAYSF
ncbi:MAG: hypothetical protein ACNS61_08880 [Candidatus Wenzhouxiangella sp. M2_3B_020]